MEKSDNQCTQTLEPKRRRKEITKTSVRTETEEQSEGIEVRNRI